MHDMFDGSSPQGPGVWHCDPMHTRTITTNAHPRHILIVEDEARIRPLPEDIPRLEGYQVLTAGTVQEAARQRLSPGGVDLVISNTQLTPALGACEGYTLAQR